MKTAITLFTGGGLADIALMAAGFTVVAGLEIDAEIAEVANKNLGGHVRVGDVLEADPKDYPRADLLHVSPPCPNFSVAKAGGEETAHDIAMAEKIAEFVKVRRPRLFTLENVRGYRQSKSFKIICDALRDCGYKWRVVIGNSADFGVPQTRIRLLVVASLDRMPSKPSPTHQKAKDEQQTGLFERSLPRWIGWYEAIEDLIPGLPESKFADWQLARLPADLKPFLMTVQGEASDYKELSEPSPAIAATHGAAKYRAFIVGAGGFDGTVVQAEQSAPIFTVTANQNQKDQLKAFIMPGGNQSARAIDELEPMFTVGSVDRVGNIPRAFISDSLNYSSVNPNRFINEPAQTVVVHSAKHPAPRAWLECGKVVKMTPRCLARFQSMPDWYELPNSDALACKLIGNGFPCLMAEAVFKQLA